MRYGVNNNKIAEKGRGFESLMAHHLKNLRFIPFIIGYLIIAGTAVYIYTAVDFYIIQFIINISNNTYKNIDWYFYLTKVHKFHFIP